jgi:hypothetical protein
MLHFFLTWPIFILALIASIFYGSYAINIFFAKAKVKDTKGEHFSWKIHQFWLNFIGSFSGWIILFFLLKRIEHLPSKDYVFTFSFQDLISFFICFIGITGYLPSTIIGIINSFGLIVSKFIESISNLFPTKKSESPNGNA